MGMRWNPSSLYFSLPARPPFFPVISRHRQLQALLWIVAVLAGMVLAMFLVGRIAYRHALQNQAAEARILLEQRAQALERHIDRFRIMPAVLSLDPQLRETLQHPDDAVQRRRANERLVQLNFANRTSTLTLIDRHGIAVAASNWHEPRSNVGHSYAFRPYFQLAMAHGTGEFYAIGTVTQVPGYFIARAVYNESGHEESDHGERGAAIGAVVVKVELDTAQLQSDWNQRGDLILLSDANGVVFLAGRREWRYRLLAPLSATQRAQLLSTQQYPGKRLRPTAIDTQQIVAKDARVTRVHETSGDARLLWQSLSLPSEGWTLHLLRDITPSVRAAWIARAVAAGAWLLLIAVTLLLWQRHRIARLRLRSRQELEKLVEQHAQALRTAQNGIVQAAQASVGQSRSLEHLPQGVSVIDDQLRLVAWNRRYAELFRYPPELLQVGRPIEDLIRYNARRGLLGDGDPEEAIRRRLEHLQRARPYLYERERPDGSVIEIRGNPMPEGGFVTSYADITAYRQAARELRTFADSLERRIEARTVDLRDAKADAERANRSKTRFVAAAVHDLLQPLNAARMYLSSLRNRVGTEERELTDHIGAALSVQDDILSSLLDISRLESGALEVRRRAFALARLLTAIEAQFRLLAQSRGLRLHVHPTRAIVDSDEVLLRRIVQNFVSNALQFTPRGGRIVLGVRRAGDAVRIEVHDSGPGIAESKFELIFEEFQRLDAGPGAAPRGAGLGLAIVRRIAVLLEHRIGVRSRLGAGSMFSVDVPRSDGPAVDETSQAQNDDDDDAPLRHRHIWVIDDDAASREAARQLLHDWGCTSETANGSVEALALARAQPRPDLILLDYRLGEDTGFALAPRLEEIWQALPPIVLVSADRNPSLRRMAAEQGWSFLPKPLRPAALRALISRMLARH